MGRSVDRIACLDSGGSFAEADGRQVRSNDLRFLGGGFGRGGRGDLRQGQPHWTGDDVNGN